MTDPSSLSGHSQVTDAATLLQSNLRERVSERIELYPEGTDRYRVFTPFTFGDGDGYGIVLVRRGRRWVLTDEGSTLMHLSYYLDTADLRAGTRGDILHRVVASFGLEDRGGELVAVVGEQAEISNRLYDFIQAIGQISDLTFLSRSTVRSTFIEDAKELISGIVPSERRIFDWHDPLRDPDALYQADVKVNSMARPLFIFFIGSTGRAREATISLQQYRIWGMEFRSLGVFESQENIGRKVVAKFSDAAGKTFSAFEPNEELIEAHILDILENS